MIQASDVITRASTILSDKTNVRWTTQEMIDWCKDAVRQIVLVRPDAYSITRLFTLKAGDSRQIVGNVAAKDNIDFGAANFEPTTRLLRVVRNGSTGGYAPIREVSRVAMDSEVSNWHVPVPLAQAPTYRAQHYVFDNVSPYTFYIYPAPPTNAAGFQVEIVHSGLPDLSQSSPSIDLGLPYQYINPLVDWVCYRAFSKDADYAGNMERAVHHMNAFALALQVSQQSGYVAASPQMATPLPAGAGWKRTGG